MANIVKLKRSAVAGKVPLTTDLDLGEIAVNTNDGKLFIKKDNGAAAVVEIGAAQPKIGDQQSWTNVFSSRTNGVSYQNTTGKPIQVNVSFTNSFLSLQISSNNSNWIEVGNMASNPSSGSAPVVAIVPAGHYYRVTTGSLGSTVGDKRSWSELR